MSNSLVYLASPYSDPDPVIRELRFKAANTCASILMREGVHVFSPISHTHPIAVEGGLPLGWDFWEQYDRAILSCCKAVLVCCLNGWERSTGVRAEVCIAAELGLPVGYLWEPLDPGFVIHLARKAGLIGHAAPAAGAPARS
jgi:hypothetical protein